MNKRRRYKAKARRRAAAFASRWRRAINAAWGWRGEHRISEADVVQLLASMRRETRLES